MVEKSKKISKKDFLNIEEYVLSEFKRRESSLERKRHEKIWRTIDQQISMQPPTASNRSGNPDEEWHSAIQMGSIADALEIISSDTLRLLLPQDRAWFIAHIEPDSALNEETGERILDKDKIYSLEGVLRSLMTQQHLDFGFRDRVKASIKECLNHGGCVITPRMEGYTKYHGGTGVERLSSPVFVPHSMWNCYPDPSPSVQSYEMFYRGKMIIRDFMAIEKVKSMPGWVRTNLVSKRKNTNKEEDTEEVEILYFIGDLYIDSGGGMHLPNRTTIVANDILVYSEVNKTPYPNVIYVGYEKDDLRDPYYTSSLIKRSPMHRLETELANKFIDNVALWAEPPIVYDGFDNKLVANGGPDIYPGSKTPAKGSTGFKEIRIGDPQSALEGWRFIKSEIERGTSVDAIRSGVSQSTEQTATEILKKDQKGEVRTVDFVGSFERIALRPFLYMQHYLNLHGLENYPFYNNEINTPDFLRLSKDDLPKSVHFDIVGSRAILGEEQRLARFSAAVQGANSNEQIASRTDWDEVTKEMWAQSGIKDPERFLIVNDQNNENGNPELNNVTAQFQEQISMLQQQLQELQIKDQAHVLEVGKLQTDINFLQETIKLTNKQAEIADDEAKLREMILKESAKLEKLNAEQENRRPVAPGS